MKTILFTLAIVTVTFLAHAQGTIWFGNSEHTRLAIGLSGGGTRLATADDNMFIGVFYGTEPSALVLAPGLATIGTEPGILVNAARTFPLPGTVP